MGIINTEIKQRTIKETISLNGVGLHTGKDVTLTFKPAEANYVTNTQRGTCLEKNGVVIQTSEHVLAALVGMDIDNVIIELNASEPPIMDGSSKFFVEALEKVGAIEQDAFREVFEITDIVSY